jgi:hypothetical protein
MEHAVYGACILSVCHTFFYCRDGVRLRICGTGGPIAHPSDDMSEYGATEECYCQRKTEGL